MGCHSQGRPLSSLLLVIFIMLIPLIVDANLLSDSSQPARSYPCDVGDCWNLFELARETLGVRGEYPPPADYTPSPADHSSHCVPMRTFFRCIQNMTAPCRGDLSFHSAKLVVEQHMRQFNCSARGKVFSASQLPSGETHRSARPPQSPVCSYRGESERVLCSVFGDPHLRAFDGSHAACKMTGAWSLLDNEYLTLQATSEALANSPGGVASALTKLTLIIKGHDDCAQGDYVTFQAPDQHGVLASTFDDGRSHFGPQRSVFISEVAAGSHVEITLRYIATRLVVRRFAGGYLSLTMSAPSDVIRDARSRNNMQLCVRGCPAPQTLSLADVFSVRSDHVTMPDSGVMAVPRRRMSREAAQERCRLAKVVDDYLDSCVFDLLSTGDVNFTRMASSALLDAIRLVPEEMQRLRNRTKVQLISQVLHSNSAHHIYLSAMQTTLLLLVLLNVL
ncbi:hypothetical protein CAPTEDRAFT_167757 [Capitella teleta]|uniref:Repulsive guidance molecule N-terminal domain-containing protein n=1 Tax=Capitella teleta TaxID=283909 RepID=R7V5F6_CAPTE|nr:hypothetical protein CAPTEDRAFT_167757 [Capitella teleta]|eukprot:ELU11025.1 hypothetical protein CAPTEDRAFT_167757 [Capitella teleta]